MIYKPLAHATLDELESHLELLSTQIIADTRRHRALKELRDLAVSAGAHGHSQVLLLLQQSVACQVRVMTR